MATNAIWGPGRKVPNLYCDHLAVCKAAALGILFLSDLLCLQAVLPVGLGLLNELLIIVIWDQGPGCKQYSSTELTAAMQTQITQLMCGLSAAAAHQASLTDMFVLFCF